MFVRNAGDGPGALRFAPVATARSAGFSPDGRRLGVLRLTEQHGRQRPHLVDLVERRGPCTSRRRRTTRASAPRLGPRLPVVRLLDGLRGGDIAGIARVRDPASDPGRTCSRTSGTSRSTRTSRAALVVHANVDGASRLTLRDPTTLARLRVSSCPTRASSTGSRLSEDGRWPRVRVLLAAQDMEGVPPRPGGRRAPRRSRRLPSGFAPDELARPVAAAVCLVRRRVDPVTSSSARGRAAGAGRRRGARRPRVAAAAGVDAVIQYLVAHGYAVAQPNVRGSTGYGKRYEHLDDGRLRLDSVRDMTTLRDELVRDPRIDGDRVVLYGGSYGGYMVLAWPRLRAGAVGGGRRRRRRSPASSPSSATRRRTVAHSASASTARSNTTSTSSTRRRR